MANEFTKWQRDSAAAQRDEKGDAKPIDLKWRASARSARRERYNKAQLEAHRDSVLFRWILGLVVILGLIGVGIYLIKS